jgi:pimeloyl-ACP methyl ester carboxylesterase
MSLEHLDVGGIPLDVLRRGAGRPLLVLHGEAPLDPGAPVVDLLATHAEVIAPTHPGFGHSARPTTSTRSTTWCTSISTCSSTCLPSR